MASTRFLCSAPAFPVRIMRVVRPGHPLQESEPADPQSAALQNHRHEAALLCVSEVAERKNVAFCRIGFAALIGIEALKGSALF